MEFLEKYIFHLPDPRVLNFVEGVIIWVGFSTIVGLVAKAIMLGKSRRTSTVVTIVLGSFGTLIGWSIANVFTNWMSNLGGSWREQVLAPITFLIAVTGTAALLLTYKLLGSRLGVMSESEK